jgi:DNA-binding MarR family transcriptional regulator
VATNPLTQLPGYLLRRASASTMGALAKRLEEFELTPSEASVLVVIGENPGIIQSEIGRMLGIVSANMTPLVSRLEERELVKRLPVDRRSFGLRTTRRGAQIAQRAYTAMQDQEAALIESVSAKHRAAFLQALSELNKALDD